MANEILANEVLAPLPEIALSEPDYRAFCAALEASARGRAFLAEYARRNRHANTEVLLTALDRLETLVARQAPTSDADRIRQELRALLAALRAAQPAIDESAAAIKAAKLAAMLGFVQHRIESIVADEQRRLPAEVAALVLPQETSQEAPPPERARLAVVPRSEEPELPIPSPEAVATPAFALVPDAVRPEAEPQPVVKAPQPVANAIAPATPRPSAAIIPEVNLFDSAPAKPVVAAPPVETVSEPVAVETVAVEAVVGATIAAPIEPPAPVAELEPPPSSAIAPTTIRVIPADAGIETCELRLEDFGTEPSLTGERAAELAQTETAPVGDTDFTLVADVVITPPPAAVRSEPIERMPAADPLALIMALSEAERIALFT